MLGVKSKPDNGLASDGGTSKSSMMWSSACHTAYAHLKFAMCHCPMFLHFQITERGTYIYIYMHDVYIYALFFLSWLDYTKHLSWTSQMCLHRYILWWCIRLCTLQSGVGGLPFHTEELLQPDEICVLGSAGDVTEKAQHEAKICTGQLLWTVLWSATGLSTLCSCHVHGCDEKGGPTKRAPSHGWQEGMDFLLWLDWMCWLKNIWMKLAWCPLPSKLSQDDGWAVVEITTVCLHDSISATAPNSFP